MIHEHYTTLQVLNQTCIILTIYSDLDTNIYQAERYSSLPTTLWCCMETIILSEFKLL